MKLSVASITNLNATALLNEGIAALDAGDREFDLSAVERCDSSAVALLLAWRRAALARRGEVRFVGVPAPLRSLATLYGVDTLIG
jgi:phospholipid transport system transporter-binding protein